MLIVTRIPQQADLAASICNVNTWNSVRGAELVDTVTASVIPACPPLIKIHVWYLSFASSVADMDSCCLRDGLQLSVEQLCRDMLGITSLAHPERDHICCHFGISARGNCCFIMFMHITHLHRVFMWPWSLTCWISDCSWLSPVEILGKTRYPVTYACVGGNYRDLVLLVHIKRRLNWLVIRLIDLGNCMSW